MDRIGYYISYRPEYRTDSSQKPPPPAENHLPAAATKRFIAVRTATAVPRPATLRPQANIVTRQALPLTDIEQAYIQMQPQRTWLKENLHKFQNAAYETDWVLLADLFNVMFQPEVSVEWLMICWNSCVWEQSGRCWGLAYGDAGFVDVRAEAERLRGD